MFHGYFDGCSLQSHHIFPNISILQPLSTPKRYYLSLWVKGDKEAENVYMVNFMIS